MRCARRALAGLVVCGALLAARGGSALTIADSTVAGVNLGIAPVSGTLQLLGPWEAEAFAQASNSLGQLQQGFDNASGGLASTSASVSWAGGAAAGRTEISPAPPASERRVVVPTTTGLLVDHVRPIRLPAAVRSCSEGRARHGSRTSWRR